MERLLVKRLVLEAVVAKRLVEVALPKRTFCDSWYAVEVVEYPSPNDEK